jgi:hypothetical protein
MEYRIFKKKRRTYKCLQRAMVALDREIREHIPEFEPRNKRWIVFDIQFLRSIDSTIFKRITRL